MVCKNDARSSPFPTDREVTSESSADARARFLAFIESVSALAQGAAQLCAACVQTLPVQRAGIVINVDGVGLEVLSASDKIAERVEWTQVTLGEGPAVDAIATGVPVSVTNLTQVRSSWPVFLAEIAHYDIGALYAIPLQVGVIKVGVLDLFCAPGATLSESGFADAIAVAELVTAVLLNVGRNGRIPGSLSSWLNQPLSTREVHQATGMVAVQLGLDARSAYVRLQAYSFGNHRLLKDVASDVVNRRLRFGPDLDGRGDIDPGQGRPTR